MEPNYKNKSNRVTYAFALFFILLFGAFALAPTLLSTTLGKKLLISKFEQKLHSKISIEHLSLGWISQQELRGIKIDENTGSYSFNCDEITSSASLFKILFQKNFKELKLSHPSLSLGLSAFTASLSPPPTLQKSAMLPSFSWKPAFLPITAHLQVQNGEFTLLRDKAPLVQYADLKIDANLSSGDAPLRFDISGTTKEEQIQGTFHILGQLGDLQNLGMTLSSDLKNFPMRGIDALISLFKPEYQGLLLNAIGPSLDLSLQGTLSPEGFGFQLNAHSALLEALINTAYKDNVIYLPSPGTVNMTFTPDFAAKLAKLLPAFEGLNLKKNLKATITFPQFVLPIKDKELDLTALSFQAILEATPSSILSRLTTQQIDLDSLRLDLSSLRLDQGLDIDLTLSARVDGMESQLSAQGKTGPLVNREKSAFTAQGAWQIEKLSLILIEEMLKQKSKITPLLGQSLDAHGSFKLEDKTLTLTVETTSPTFSLTPTTLIWKDNLTLSAPTTLRFAPSKAFLNAVLPESLILKPGSSCEVKIQELSVPLNTNFEQLSLKAAFSADTLAFDKFGEFGSLSFNQVTGNIEIDTLRSIQIKTSLTPCDVKHQSCGLLDISTHAALDLKKQELIADSKITLSVGNLSAGNLHATLTGKQFRTSNPNWTLLIDGDNLSIPLFDKMLHQGTALSALFGPTLNLHLDAQKEKVQVKATSANLNVHGAFALKDKTLTLAQEPFEIFFSMNADGFAKLEKWFSKEKQASPAFELSQPTIFALTISSLNIPFSKNFDWREIQLAATGGADKFAFQEKSSGQLIKLDQLHLKLEKKEKLSPFSVELSSLISTKESTTGKTSEGKLSCTGSIQEDSSLSCPSLELNATIEEFPTAIFDLVAHLTDTSSLKPLFGDKLDATAYVCFEQGSGPIQLNLRSSNSRFSIVGAVKEGVLSLSEPIYAQVLMTEELTRPLLKEVNPLSISSISSSHPLTLEIQPEGFTLPLDNWKKISLSHAKIELGQLTCQNQGTFQITLGLLKSKEFAKDKQLELWFAPMDLSIAGGIVNIERTEILVAQTFEVATWGTLNLFDETVDMVLGLTAQCLNKAFSIKDLPPDYVMHIPMKGKMNDVQINTKSATAKIAALLIWQQKSVTDSLGKGFPGSAFGELLGRLATLPDSGAKTPPAKRPFPWDGNKPSKQERKKESSSIPNKKKNRIHKDDKPLKQLLKILR